LFSFREIERPGVFFPGNKRPEGDRVDEGELPEVQKYD